MKRLVLASLLFLLLSGATAQSATPTPHVTWRLPLLMKDSTPTTYLALVAKPIPTDAPQLPEASLSASEQAEPAPDNNGQAQPEAAPTEPAPTPDPVRCANLVYRNGEQLMLNGEPIQFVGFNAVSLMDPSFPEGDVPRALDELAGWGANLIRVFVKPGADLDRFERLLDLAGPRGLRLVVTLQDYYFYKDQRWFETFYKEKDLPHIEEVVTRFRNRPEIAIWEVMNEPWCGANGEADDPKCYASMQSWAADTTGLIRRLDPCRPISLGLMGQRNLSREKKAYRALQSLSTVDIVSIHAQLKLWYEDDGELDVARELGKPVLLGEVYKEVYKPDGKLRNSEALTRRAAKVDIDVHQALERGIAGYLLWNYVPAQTDSDGQRVVKDYGVYDFLPGDPVGPVIQALPLRREPVIP